MKLIVGLGNIGPHFEGTRHNTGFAMVDLFAAAHSLEWQQKDRFKAVVAEGAVSNQKIVLAKPITYYNLSGDAVQALKQFYKLQNSDILVAHDELAMPLGSLRARIGGSDAGNNGIKSIIASIGDDFARLRIGIGGETPQEAADYVLSRFNRAEAKKIHTIATHCSDLMLAFIDGRFEHTTIQV